MIGQPMDASGFATLASHFPDRTVVTYDPRGLGRSTRKDGRVDHAPTVQAERRARRDRGARRRPGRDVREQRRRGDRARARGGPSRRRDHPGGARAAADPGAPRRRGGRARPRRRSRRLRGQGLGRRHGGLHRDDVVAGRVHRRLLRPARAGSRRVRDADRGRRLAATTRCSPTGPGRSAAIAPTSTRWPRRRRAS